MGKSYYPAKGEKVVGKKDSRWLVLERTLKVNPLSRRKLLVKGGDAKGGGAMWAVLGSK